MKHLSNNKIINISLVLAVLLLAWLVWTQYKDVFFKNPTTFSDRANTILGVPYEGTFKRTPITTSASFAAYTTVRYWRDERVELDEIMANFDFDFDTPAAIRLNDVGNFLASYGYNVSYNQITEAESLRDYIDQGIPVLVSQQLALDGLADLRTIRVAIGYSDPSETLIFHDNYFGNNYEISYDEFEELNADTAAVVLVASPPLAEDQLDFGILGPNETLDYPARTNLMESADLRAVRILWLTINHLRAEYYAAGASDQDLVQEIVASYETMINHPGFIELPPNSRIRANFMLARIYSNVLDRPEDAVQLIESEILPVVEGETDLRAAYLDWGALADDFPLVWYETKPYVLLGIAYQKLGENDLAREAFLKALTADPNDQEAQQGLQSIN